MSERKEVAMSEEEERPHRLKVTIEEGVVSARMECPGEPDCKPADFCSECGRDANEPEGRDPCECCPKPSDGCNLRNWFDGMGTELIEAEFEAEVEVEWIGPEDGPILHLTNLTAPEPVR